MRKSIAILTLVGFCSFSQAADNPIFSCKTANGQVTIKKSGNDYVYNDGKRTFKNSIKSVYANKSSESALGSEAESVTLELKDKGRSYQAGYIKWRKTGNIDEPNVVIKDANENIIEIIECTSKPVSNFDYNKIRKSGFWN